MRKIYRVLALLVALEVVVQAAALALGVAGLAHWVDGGGVPDGDALHGDSRPFPEAVGFLVHGINGSTVIPALAVLLFVVSFFSHVPRGTAWAGIVLLLVVVQGLLGFSLADVPALGALHGVNALLLLAAAAVTARRARPPRGTAQEDQPETAEAGAEQ